MKDLTITLEGTLPASAAAWNTSSLAYLPFDVPPGVTSIHVQRDLVPRQKHTVALLLFDARGAETGFRGFMGQVNTDTEFTISILPNATSPCFLPGPLPSGRWYIGQWFVHAVSEELSYRYTITLSFAKASAISYDPAPPYDPGVVNPDSGWYVGGLHNHTRYSYDAHIGGTPYSTSGLVRKYAEAGFDFLAITDHDQPRSHADAPQAARENPDTLLILGYEITTLHGHANTLFVPPGTQFDFRLDPGDGKLPGLFEQAHRAGAIVSVNHPFQKSADCTWRFPASEWVAADAIEVWNRPWKDINRQAVDLWDGMLKQGSRIPAIGGADYHRGDAPLTPATWVYARELSLTGVKEAILKRHISLSEGPSGPKLTMNTENGRAMIGDVVETTGGSPIRIITRVEGGEGCLLRLITRFGERSVRVLSNDFTEWNTVSIGPVGANYLRAELIRPNGDVAALTNPIFISKN